jgi:vacuole morphology and inheritance protein 14
MKSLLDLFSQDKRLLETRGTLVIRHLCKHLEAGLTLFNLERIYICLAQILLHHNDIEFASLMVQNLNLILITAPELSVLRTKLKNAPPTQPLFSILYKSFCHNPVSLFALCLLAGCYDHASTIITALSDIQINVSHLIQLDKLVQLLESPIFSSLRLHLLEPEKHSCLYKALYGILMILPQSSAFETLRNRLECVNIATLILPKRKDKYDWAESISFFKSVLERHEGGKNNRTIAANIRNNRTKTASLVTVSNVDAKSSKPPRRYLVDYIRG